MREWRKDDQAEAALCGELTRLFLYDCRLQDADASLVAKYMVSSPTVAQLRLRRNKIGPWGASEIAKAVTHSKVLWELNLGGNMIGDEGAEALITMLAHNVCITELCATENAVSLGARTRLEYLTRTRNKVLIPAAVRRAALCLIAFRRAENLEDAGDFANFPKEIVKMIAIKVWATRKDPIWIGALSESELIEQLDAE